MLFPKKVKHRKWQSKRINMKKTRIATRGTTLAFGQFGLKATSPDRISSNQIEAARRVLSRSAGKLGRVWIRIFPDRPETQKGAELPMGKGKGDPARYVAEVFPGRIMFEMDGVDSVIAKDALRRAGRKLSVTTAVVTRVRHT
jgi:large subunit ribosomal protein L16